MRVQKGEKGKITKRPAGHLFHYTRRIETSYNTLGIPIQSTKGSAASSTYKAPGSRTDSPQIRRQRKKGEMREIHF